MHRIILFKAIEPTIRNIYLLYPLVYSHPCSMYLCVRLIGKIFLHWLVVARYLYLAGFICGFKAQLTEIKFISQFIQQQKHEKEAWE